MPEPYGTARIVLPARVANRRNFGLRWPAACRPSARGGTLPIVPLLPRLERHRACRDAEGIGEAGAVRPRHHVAWRRARSPRPCAPSRSCCGSWGQRASSQDGRSAPGC